jgi:hypothetical protein
MILLYGARVPHLAHRSKNMNKVIIGLAVSGMLFLSGCASVPMGDETQDAALKNFTAPQEVAGLYIYRNESIGAGVKMEVEVDGQPLGKTAALTYLYTELPSGKHTIVSRAENDDSLDVEVQAGKLYYIWQEVKMGFLYARNKLQLVDEPTGQAGVLATKLAVPEAK